MYSFYYSYFEHRRIAKNALLFMLAVATVAAAVILVMVKAKGA